MDNVYSDPTKRFSSRVNNYIKYRPGYPPEIINFLKAELAVDQNKIVADLGSGTGILTELLLKNKYFVYAVEPNAEMRQAAERMLNSYPNFRSIDGSAEKTGLEANSIDLIAAAPAFHWFEINKAKEEFIRIIKKGGWIVLLWNTRVNDASPFMTTYENFLLEHSIDYVKVSHTNIDESKLRNFFTSGYNTKQFSNTQVFDFESLKGRVLSSSYMPGENESTYESMLNALKRVFHKYNKNGFVEFVYKTEMYFGRL
ncbi:MAG: class I SAM-dependent methyltransferase [Ignavibacteria bacterium]